MNVFIYTVGKRVRLKLHDVFIVKKNVIKKPNRATKKHKLVIRIYHARTKIRKAGAKARIMRKKVFIGFL